MDAKRLIGEKCHTRDGNLVAVEDVFVWIETAPRKAMYRQLEPVLEGGGYGQCWVADLTPLDPSLKGVRFV